MQIPKEINLTKNGFQIELLIGKIELLNEQILSIKHENFGYFHMRIYLNYHEYYFKKIDDDIAKKLLLFAKKNHIHTMKVKHLQRDSI